MPGRRAKGAPPPYLKHKSKGQAYCTINGKQILLGPFGSDESHRKHEDILRQWREQKAAKAYVPGPGCVLGQLVAAFLDHTKEHYHPQEHVAIKRCLRPLMNPPYATLAADRFSPVDLDKIRSEWTTGAKTRNKDVGRVRLMFRWAVGKGLVPHAVWHALTALDNLRGDHGEKVRPAEPEAVASVLAHPELREDVRTMIRLQLLCGARPGEVCRMREEEIDREGRIQLKGQAVKVEGVWVFQPGQFKQLHRGLVIYYLLGPQAQELITDYLSRPRLRKWANSTPTRQNDELPKTPYLFPGKRVGQPWREDSYATYIADVCAELGCEHWSPNQLRHSAVSRVEAVEGIARARELVGHRNVATTQGYVDEVNQARRAAEIAQRHG